MESQIQMSRLFVGVSNITLWSPSEVKLVTVLTQSCPILTLNMYTVESRTSKGTENIFELPEYSNFPRVLLYINCTGTFLMVRLFGV